MTPRIKSLFALVLAGAVAVCGCTPGPRHQDSTENPGSMNPAGEDTITVFLTGNVLSTLEPCGCSAGQLGGFSRRAAVLATVAEDRRFVADTGNLLRDRTPQDVLKLGIMFQALSMLRYDAANLNADELALGTELGLVDGADFAVITSAGQVNPQVKAVYSKRLRAAGRTILVSIASAKAQAVTAASLRSLFGGVREEITLNILIVDDCPDDTADKIRHCGIVDVVVCPAIADEPRIVHKDGTHPLFVSVGRLGKYFARLTGRLTDDNKLHLRYDKVAVDEKLPEDAALVQLYDDYKLMVRQEGLLEASPRVPLPDGLKYLGSENCRSCHGYEYDRWATRGHAHAYETLVKVGSQYDPECVRCHVTGFGYESGFINQDSAKDLRNVGCEVCHGPGSGHMKAVTTGRGGTGMAQPQSKCIDCHSPDRSPGYQGNEKEFLKKIVHWREQKTSGTVQQ